MNLWVLGKGKTGSLVAQIAQERGHQVRALDGKENARGAALIAENLKDVDLVIDFTTPKSVLGNISACAGARKNMVVGTTGWYAEMDYVRKLVAQSGIGFLWGANFSIGVNIFFDIARAAGVGSQYGYEVKIIERHHAKKKDAPSGTAVSIQQIIETSGRNKPEIASIREGETVGTHVILLDGKDDTMMLVHDAKSRVAFADGAVRAGEWLRGRVGFYDFREIFPQLASSS